MRLKITFMAMTVQNPRSWKNDWLVWWSSVTIPSVTLAGVDAAQITVVKDCGGGRRRRLQSEFTVELQVVVPTEDLVGSNDAAAGFIADAAEVGLTDGQTGFTVTEVGAMTEGSQASASCTDVTIVATLPRESAGAKTAAGAATMEARESAGTRALAAR